MTYFKFISVAVFFAGVFYALWHGPRFLFFAFTGLFLFALYAWSKYWLTYWLSPGTIDEEDVMPVSEW